MKRQKPLKNDSIRIERGLIWAEWVQPQFSGSVLMDSYIRQFTTSLRFDVCEMNSINVKIQIHTNVTIINIPFPHMTLHLSGD